MPLIDKSFVVAGPLFQVLTPQWSSCAWGAGGTPTLATQIIWTITCGLLFDFTTSIHQT